MLALVAVSVLSLVAQNVAGSSNLRIYFGHDANRGDHPWMVSFQGDDGEHKCGGSLVSKTAVLTAAHCVGRHRPDIKFQVGLGLNKLSEAATDPNAQIIPVHDVIEHPQYDANNGYINDIAIVTLSKEAVLSDAVQIAELSDLTVADVKGKSFTVRGWGETESQRPYADTLQAAEFESADRSLCDQKLEFYKVEDYHICVQGKDRKVDTCVGDSGGPLMYAGKQVGVLSQGFVNCHEAYPSMYVNVAAFMPWIKQHIPDIGIRSSLD